MLFRSLRIIRVYSSQPPRFPRSQDSQGDRVSSFTDPYPLPLSKETLSAKSDIPPEGSPLRIPRENESIQTLRARLIYQSRKRGTLETDLLLSTFASEYLESMSEEEMHEFDKLMDEPDWDIYYWAVGRREVPTRWASSVLLAKLKKHAANEGKVVRRMPDLNSPKQ